MCDLDGAMDEFEKVKAERDRLRIRLKAIYDIGHNDDCLFCGFKDKFALEALAERRGDDI